MNFIVPQFDDIRASLLRDIQALLPEAVVGEDSDFFIRASALAAALEGEYQHQVWLLRQVFPDTAEAAYLERHASLRGLSRKQANAATGSITVTGAAGSVIPLGTQWVDPSGLLLVASEALTLGVSGTGALAVTCASAGTVGNLPVGTVLSCIAAPVGVQSNALVAALSSGTDIESDVQLLERLLEDIRNPPSGGNAFDYKRWAMSLAGVSDAYVFPLRRGVGTVDVVIETSGGLPSVALVAQVQTYLNSVRPLTADVAVMAPTLLPVDVSALLTVSGISSAEAVAKITAALTTYFARLQVGETVYRARLINLMMSVPGVVNVSLTAPATDISPLVNASAVELATLGMVTLI